MPGSAIPGKNRVPIQPSELGTVGFSLSEVLHVNVTTVWNGLPSALFNNSYSPNTFRQQLKTYLVDNDAHHPILSYSFCTVRTVHKCHDLLKFLCAWFFTRFLLHLDQFMYPMLSLQCSLCISPGYCKLYCHCQCHQLPGKSRLLNTDCETGH